MIFALAALLAVAQAQEPPPPAEVVQAGQALSTCIGGQLDAADDSVPAETVTDALLAHCRPQIDTAVAAHGRWVDSTTLTAEEKAAARAAMQRSVTEMRGQIIAAIQEGRSQRAPAPAAAPAPAQN